MPHLLFRVAQKRKPPDANRLIKQLQVLRFKLRCAGKPVVLPPGTEAGAEKRDLPLDVNGLWISVGSGEILQPKLQIWLVKKDKFLRIAASKLICHL